MCSTDISELLGGSCPHSSAQKETSKQYIRIKRFASSVVRVMVCPTAAFSPSRIQSQCRAWKRNGKIIVAGVGKQRFDVRRTEKRCREEKIRAEDPPPPMKSALMATRQRPCSLPSVPDPSSNASNECVTRCARS